MTIHETETITGRAWTCALGGLHRPLPLRGCVHHVWPQGAGGPDTPDNRVDCCETHHANQHEIMWALAHGRPAPKCGRSELALARRGVAAWVAAGHTIGTDVPTAFLG